MSPMLKKAMAAVRAMRWSNFELLIAEGFRLQGFSVTEMRELGADGGVNMILVKGADRYLVQCEDWQADSIEAGAVEELARLAAVQGAAGGFVVTCGEPTREAAALARERKIQFVNGPKLLAMLEKARTTITAPLTARLRVR